MALHQTINNGTARITRIASPVPAPKHGLPPICDEEALFHYLGISPQYGWYVIRNPERSYTKFWIDKDTKEFVPEYDSGRRLREILAPTKKLKRLHGRIAALLSAVPKHWANYAYMKGKSIKHAAEHHKFGEVLIRVDLKDFFPSHTAGYIRRRLQEVTGYSEAVCWVLARLCTVHGKMPQGAVTSPVLSIILNIEMDRRLHELGAADNLAYTRYADDLLFSGADRSLRDHWAFVDKVLRNITPFSPNKDKIDVMRHSSYSYNFGVSISGLPADAEDALDLSQVTGRNLCVNRRANGTLDIYAGDKRPFTAEMESRVSEAVRAAAPSDVSIRAKRYYVQSIKRMLGVHLTTPGEIHYPRRKFNAMRLEAMLAAHEAENINMAKFRGKLAYMRFIDPGKAAKIDRLMGHIREQRVQGQTVE